MLFSDLVLIGALGMLVIVWWKRRLPSRDRYLNAMAIILVIVGGWSAMDYRWQGLGAAVLGLVVLLIQFIKSRRGKPVPDSIPWISGPLMTLLAAIAAGAGNLDGRGFVILRLRRPFNGPWCQQDHKA